MSCEITRNIEPDCRDIGGVRELYIGNFVGTQLTYTLTGNLITSFHTPAGYSLFTFPQPLEVAEWTSTPQTSNDNGTTFYNNKIGMSFYQLSADTNDLIDTLVKGRFLIIVLDNNGRYFLLGYDFGATVKVGTIGAGKNASDLNGAKLDFETREKRVVYEVSEAAVQSILTPDLGYEITLAPAMTLSFRTAIDPITSGMWQTSYSRLTASFITTKGLKTGSFTFSTPQLNYNKLSSLTSGSASLTSTGTAFNNPLTRINYDLLSSPLGPKPDFVVAYFDNSDNTIPFFVDNNLNSAYDRGVMLISPTTQELDYYAQSNINVSLYASNTSIITLLLTSSMAEIPQIEFQNPIKSWQTDDGAIAPYPLDPLNSILWTLPTGVFKMKLVTQFLNPVPYATRSIVVTVF